MSDGTRRARSRAVSAPAVAVLVLAALVATACGSDTPRSLTVERAWARTTPGGATNGVVYLTITSPVADRLTSVTVDRSVAASAALHASMASGGGGMANMPGMAGGGGMATMTPLDHVVLPAGEPVAFEPGGRHVMLSGLVRPLDAGDRFEVVVHLRRQGARRVTVTVRDNAPTGG